uniref:Uncharacterized protein n=1 Tax=Arundo donax TaxID=35708 RepID=A0A0A8YII9_ARUDO
MARRDGGVVIRRGGPGIDLASMRTPQGREMTNDLWPQSTARATARWPRRQIGDRRCARLARASTMGGELGERSRRSTARPGSPPLGNHQG